MNCATYTNCPLPALYPLLGYSAETPEVQTFTAMGYGPITPPPLNWQFGRATAFAIRSSTISQEDADQSAYDAAVDEAESTWTNPVGVPPLVWEEV